MAEGVLAVGRDVVALLPEHLVELGAPVAADELDAGGRVGARERAEELEQTRVDVDPRAGDAVGEHLVEAGVRGAVRVERDARAAVGVDERGEERRAGRRRGRRLLVGEPGRVLDPGVGGHGRGDGGRDRRAGDARRDPGPSETARHRL